MAGNNRLGVRCYSGAIGGAAIILFSSTAWCQTRVPPATVIPAYARPIAPVVVAPPRAVPVDPIVPPIERVQGLYYPSPYYPRIDTPHGEDYHIKVGAGPGSGSPTGSGVSGSGGRPQGPGTPGLGSAPSEGGGSAAMRTGHDAPVKPGHFEERRPF